MKVNCKSVCSQAKFPLEPYEGKAHLVLLAGADIVPTDK